VIASQLGASLRLLAGVFLLCYCSSSTPGKNGQAPGGEAGEAAHAGEGNADGGTPSDSGSAGEPSGGTGHSGASGDGGSVNGGTSSGSTGAAGEGPGAGGTAGHGGTGFGAFMLGADISSLPETVDAGVTFVDTDGAEKDLITLLGDHGFNYVRLRSFVDPSALYGYANPNGQDQFKKAEPYCDTAHTLEVAHQAKQAGMGFLLDLHYSDNWADPGKQVIPEAWRGATSMTELADHVKSYTTAVVSELVQGGARPDMVQIGNEITPGLLIHIPAENPDADQWGNMTKLTNPYNGSVSNFNNVATLLKAGIDGVKAVDPTIKIMLHLENTNSFPAVRDWLDAVRARGVKLDVLGLSCYPTYQGQPMIWKDTFEQLTQLFDDISFVIAEYNPQATAANQIMADLPDGRGLGTFFWEPTQSGNWGPSLFDRSGDKMIAKEASFAEFDALKVDLGL
jgi:arabinogalactan endo-1,4-beta-galactosidase